MKKIMVGIMCLALTGRIWATESVAVPWEEIKILFEERVERNVQDKLNAAAQSRKTMVASIDEAIYGLSIGSAQAVGQVLISGKLVEGDPRPIGLFGKGIILTGVKRAAGGALIGGQEEGIAFLPDGRKEFQVEISFLVPVQEDNRSRLVSLAIPTALRNALTLTLPENMRLVEGPGLADTAGVYHFPVSQNMVVRFRDRKALAEETAIEINTLSRIALEENRAMVSTRFLPMRPINGPVTLHVEDGAQFIGSSLKPSWLRKTGEDSYQLDLPAGMKEGFVIDLLFPLAAGENAETSFRLPGISNNRGQEGSFILEECADGHASVAAKELVRGISVSRLPNELAAHAGKLPLYDQVASREKITVSLRKFKTVSTPAAVLDTLYFYTSFEENGNRLSVLQMDIPPEIGMRLKVKSIAGADIWSLTVNGAKRKVFTDQEGRWIIPLTGTEPSQVELAIIAKGEKLGLHGRLETVLPETDIPARKVVVGVALPERVELLALEGAVNPGADDPCKLPAEFVGRPYYFSRAFYKGEGMNLAVSYKEPVRETGK
ncbi:MAG: hypothetical protein KKG09_09785 [Verrucomicrobia bacterium]|nr:hypothetical protein [Verrucomicrobiota bacterium]MCG2680527.1 hypothetical protein [Kiritimatiellia bacterium]MBU4248250.1 hypothetical protein [Verrucomicrobiota bacterium]MBU4290453.1 hypothetical protein [Verrucomicrobiota bacterium]MBU4428583.1 hypothetical protein [Verrucomicrobiota bacterium]